MGTEIKIPKVRRCRERVPVGTFYWAVSDSWEDPTQCFPVRELGMQVDQHYWDERRYFPTRAKARLYAASRLFKVIDRMNREGEPADRNLRNRALLLLRNDP